MFDYRSTGLGGKNQKTTREQNKAARTVSAQAKALKTFGFYRSGYPIVEGPGLKAAFEYLSSVPPSGHWKRKPVFEEHV